MEYYTYNNDELTHWGIKGMRWGIRRFQNKDGSLTPAGKKRRAKLEGELDKLGGSSKKSDSGTDATPRKKTVGEMTDEELDQAIARARKEDTYRQLRPEPVAKPKLMSRLINEVVVPSAINSGKKMLEGAMNQAVDKLLKGKVDPNSVEALTKVRDKLKLQSEINKYRKYGDADVNWENMLRKQKYLKNEKDEAAAAAKAKAKEDAEAAKAEATESAKSRVRRQNLRNAWDRMQNKHNNPEDGERRRNRVEDEIDWDNWDGRSSSSRVHEGTVEGVGANSRTRKRAESWTRKSDIIDMETYELVTTNNTSSGRSYVSNYLALPAPGLPAPRDDD